MLINLLNLKCAWIQWTLQTPNDALIESCFRRVNVSLSFMNEKFVLNLGGNDVSKPSFNDKINLCLVGLWSCVRNFNLHKNLLENKFHLKIIYTLNEHSHYRVNLVREKSKARQINGTQKVISYWDDDGSVH